MFLNFLLALLPIIWLFIAFLALKMPGYLGCLIALAIAVVESIVLGAVTGGTASTVMLHGLNLAEALSASLEGVLGAVFPIAIIIIAAMFTYNLCVETKAMDLIKRMLTSVTNDKRKLVLILAWGFGGFMEAVAGFGTAVAIPAAMMVAVGFDPMFSAVACLLTNACNPTFGSIGIPTTTLASITGLDPVQLALTQALQVAPFVLITPFLMIMIVGGGPKALKGVVPITLITGLAVCLPEIAAAAFIGADLPMVVAAVVALVVTFVAALKLKGDVPAEYALETPKSEEALTADKALRAWAPFILIFVILVLTSKLVPFINGPLSSIKTVVNIYKGDPDATLTFSWINTPGVLILICGIVGGLIQGCPFPEMMGVLGATCKQMSKTILTMLAVLGCAKIMGYSGMIASIAAFFVSTLGGLYPLVAPVLGALGTFVTGSGTSSEVLFGSVQQQAAQAIGADEYWLCAANSLGVSAGKMLSPQSIAIGTASCGLMGKDGEVLGKVAPFAFGFVIAMALFIQAGVMLGL